MSLTSYRAAPSRGKPVALAARTRYLAIAAGLGKAPGGQIVIFFIWSLADDAERGNRPDGSPRGRFRARGAAAHGFGRGSGRGAPAGRRAGGGRRHRGARVPQGNEGLSARTRATLKERLEAIGAAAEAATLTDDLRWRMRETLDHAATAESAWPLDEVAFGKLADGLAASYERARDAFPEDW